MAVNGGVMEDRVRRAYHDDDLAHPVLDSMILLSIISDCYLNVASILGSAPSRPAVAIAGVSTANVAAVEVRSIGEFLYSDSLVTELVLPKMSYEFVMHRRGGRLALAQQRPACFAAKQQSDNLLHLYFDTVCPADATASIWLEGTPTRLGTHSSFLFLSELGLNLVEKMSTIACIARLTTEQMQQLKIAPGVVPYLQQGVDSVLREERTRVAASELPDRITETES